MVAAIVAIVVFVVFVIVVFVVVVVVVVHTDTTTRREVMPRIKFSLINSARWILRWRSSMERSQSVISENDRDGYKKKRDLRFGQRCGQNVAIRKTRNWRERIFISLHVFF